MPSHAGPNTAGESNLVFSYDTGDTSNSYKGEPTTNLATDSPSDVGGWGGYYLLVDSATKSFNLRVNDGGAGSAWKSFYWNVSSYIGQYITITANYTFGTEYNCNFQHITVGQGNTGPYPIHIAGSDEVDRLTISSKTSQQITWSGVINDTGIVGFTVWLADASAGAYTICNVSNVQIEAKSHKTPFINEGLKDLMVTNQIDLSNVSFDSNAQMIFDGTDDYIPLSTITLGNASWTIECIVLANANSYNILSNSSDGPVTHAFGFYGNKIYYQNYDGSWQTHYGNTTLSFGTYYHFTWVNINNTMQMYVNGQTDSSIFNSYTTNGGPVDAIGRNWFSYFNGKLPIFKYYNTTLSSNQVKQNYQQYKTRFNLS